VPARQQYKTVKYERRLKMLNKTKVVRTITILLAVLLYSNGVYAEELLVSAAMSLKNVFEEIAPIYEQQVPDVTIHFNFGSSGALEKQIEAGAPADVFASASQRFMDMLEKENGITPGSCRHFAQNSMVLIVPRDNPANINGFNDLGSGNRNKICIGNPGSVPAGRYAKEVLQNMNLYQKIQKNLIMGEHVRQVLDYVARGEVDAGIVYATDARIRSKEVKVLSAAPRGSHTDIFYPAAVVSSSQLQKQALDFVEFLSKHTQAKELLQKHGFSLIGIK